MKFIATVILSGAFCGLVSAAPISDVTTETHKAVAVDILSASETGNMHGADVRHTAPVDCPPPVEVIPEPASMALLGIGLGLAALRRRRS
jgi:hypothetical protein